MSFARVGLGAASPIVNMGTQTAGIATAALALIPATGPLAPFVAIGVGLFSLFSNVFGLGSGCGQTCILATKVVDQVEPYLKQNLQVYQNGGRTASEQRTALQVVDAAFADVQNGCSNPALGSAGQRCISERLVKGGTAPWCPKPGNTGCDWVTLYRDPIANDPNVQPDPTLQNSTLVTLANGQVVSVPNPAPSQMSSFSFSNPLLVIGGLLAAALILPRVL